MFMPPPLAGMVLLSVDQDVYRIWLCMPPTRRMSWVYVTCWRCFWIVFRKWPVRKFAVVVVLSCYRRPVGCAVSLITRGPSSFMCLPQYRLRLYLFLLLLDYLAVLYELQQLSYVKSD
jgi:hypothetical protein